VICSYLIFIFYLYQSVAGPHSTPFFFVPYSPFLYLCIFFFLLSPLSCCTLCAFECGYNVTRLCMCVSRSCLLITKVNITSFLRTHVYLVLSSLVVFMAWSLMSTDDFIRLLWKQSCGIHWNYNGHMKLGLFKMYLSSNGKESLELAIIVPGVIEWFSFTVSNCL